MIAATPMAGQTRNIISVELIPGANTALDRAVKETGLAKKDIIARLLAWYGAQDGEVRQIALGMLPKSLVAAAQTVALERIRANPLSPDAGTFPSIPPTERHPAHDGLEETRDVPPARNVSGKGSGKSK